RHAARTGARALCDLRDGDRRRRHRAGDRVLSPASATPDVRVCPGDCARRDRRAAEVRGMVMKHTWLAFRRDQRGAALVEMALTLPLMLLVSAGIFDFGRAYQTWQVITNAAREGARIAVLPGTTDANITARVRTYISAGQLANAATTPVVIDHTATIPVGIGTSSATRATVNYPFTFAVLQPIAQLINPRSKTGAPLTMTVSALMRNE